MAVNLSVMQLADPQLPQIVSSILKDTGMTAGMLCLEITEGVMMIDPEVTLDVLNELKDLGCEIAADLPEEFSPSIGNQVTAVVRPEHASLASMDSEFDLSGILSNIVYVGTDTHYYVDIGTGESFVARLQNTRDGGQIGTIGSTVGVRFQRNAIQVLKD